ncbi:MAG: serine hydrolase domain-containing protein [Chloroflexota bacterium]
MGVLAEIDEWGADHAAAATVSADGVIERHGDADHEFRWASITKLLTATVVLRDVEAGSIDLDEPAGPPGASVRHLLAHASGLPFEGANPISRPGAMRIYSNTGYDLLGALVEERTGRGFGEALHALVLDPLGMSGARLEGRPSSGVVGRLDDLVRFVQEFLRPSVLTPDSIALATTVAFPGLAGVLPGFGRFDVLDWGLGFAIRGEAGPGWSGRRNSAATFGHFGGSGTLVWVDPAVELALASLTDRAFGPWATSAWPALSDRVIAAHRRTST